MALSDAGLGMVSRWIGVGRGPEGPRGGQLQARVTK